MVLINKFSEALFVSVKNVSLLDVSFFCFLFNVARLSLYGYDGERETLTCNFARDQISPTIRCPKITCEVFLSTLPVGSSGSLSTVNETNCNKKKINFFFKKKTF